LLDEITAKRIQGLIAFRLDRISRDQAHLGVFITTMQRAKAEFLLADETFDDTPEGKLMMSIGGFIAEQNRRTIAALTLMGREARQEEATLPRYLQSAVRMAVRRGHRSGKARAQPRRSCGATTLDRGHLRGNVPAQVLSATRCGRRADTERSAPMESEDAKRHP